MTRNFTIHANCPKVAPNSRDRKSVALILANGRIQAITPFGSPSIECRNIAPEFNDDIEIVGGRLKLNRLAHLHSPTPTGLEAAIHLAVEDLHRERQEGPCFGATALGPSRWTKVQFLSSPPWKIRHCQLPQLQSKWQAYNICLCGMRSRRRHGMRRAVDVAPHGLLSYYLPARTSVAFAAGNFDQELSVAISCRSANRRKLHNFAVGVDLRGRCCSHHIRGATMFSSTRFRRGDFSRHRVLRGGHGPL